MDINLFTKIAEQAYNELLSAVFSFDECLSILRLYFDRYKDFCGEEHPPLKREQITRIMRKMPYCEPLRFISKGHPMAKDYVQLLPEDYTDNGLICAYFKKQYKPPCDHRIFHFFSGCVRTVLFYELRGNGML